LLRGRPQPPGAGWATQPDLAGAASSHDARLAATSYKGAEMERSTSMMWVSAPSADLGDGQSLSCRAAHSSKHSHSSAVDIADAAPDAAGCLRAGSIQVAAAYANVLQYLVSPEAAVAAQTTRCFMYQTMLPQSWAVLIEGVYVCTDIGTALR
jgi:hypothetical protein